MHILLLFLSINMCASLQCDSSKSTTLFIYMYFFFGCLGILCFVGKIVLEMAWRAWRWILLNSTGSISVLLFLSRFFSSLHIEWRSLALRCVVPFVCSRLLPTVEMSEMSVTQSVECPLTVTDTAVVSGHLSTRNGNGAGSISLALRRVLSHSAWAEVIN